MQRLQGYVEKGNTTVAVAGLSSATKLQGSFPGATVTAYINSPPAVAIPSIARSANVVTVQVPTGSGFIAGEQVTIAGVTNNSFNGVFVIATAGASSFTYAQVGPDAASTGGTAYSTLRLASIYSDNGVTPKANPFVADSVGSWFLYGDDGRYDVKFTGGGLPAPLTAGDFMLFDEESIWLNVRNAQFGARGDGATDDSYAFAAAVAALPTTTCGQILVPPGSYLINSTVVFSNLQGAVIKGMGMRASIIIPGNSLVGLPMFQFKDCRDCTIENIRFYGNTGNAPSSCIEFRNVAGGSVAPTNNMVFRCLFGSATAASIERGIHFVGDVDANNDDHKIEFCYFANFSIAAIHIGHSSSLSHQVHSCSADSTNDANSVFIRLNGGSFTMTGGQLSIGNNGYDFDFYAPPAGTYQYPSHIIGVNSESAGKILRTDGTANIWVYMTNYHRQGVTPASIPMDFQSDSGRMFMTQCHFNLGQVNTFSFSDDTQFISIHNCQFNSTVITWAGQLALWGVYDASNATFTPIGTARMLKGGTWNGLVVPGAGTIGVGMLTGVEGISGDNTVVFSDLRGTVQINGGGVTGDGNFSVDQPDTNYRVVVTPVTVPGGASAGSTRPRKITKLISKFILEVEADPGGVNVIFDWHLIR